MRCLITKFETVNNISQLKEMHRCSFLLLLCITPPPNSSSWASKLANWIFGSPIIIYSKRRKVNTPHHIDGFLRWNRIAQAKLPKIRPNASIAASSTSFDTHWAMHIYYFSYWNWSQSFILYKVVMRQSA